MVETAIYVLLGALTTALLALLALPAVSRRAARLAHSRARLLAPLSATEAEAERDALRGRHAIELTLVERVAEAAQDKWAGAQIVLGQRAAEIVKRDADIADKAGEIARQREELATLSRELTGRDTEIAARETALRDFEGQRDAADNRSGQTTALLLQTRAEAERAEAQLHARIEEISRELSLTRHRGDSDLFAAKAAISDLERRLEESEAEGSRLRRQIADVAERLATPPSGGDAAAPALDPGRPPDAVALIHARLADAAVRETQLGARAQALVAAVAEAEAAARAAREDREAAEHEAELWRERAEASEALAARLTQSDEGLRQAIARLGHELVATQAPVDSQPEPAS